jgi:hypothetical protein
MSTNAKIGIAVGALVALVFAVSIISLLPTGGGGPDPANQPTEAAKEGLLAYARMMRYEPTAQRVEYRECQQYYEAGDLSVPFWVCNKNDVPISVRFGYTSCAQCSLAEFAVVPALPFDPEGDPDPFAAVVGGVAGKAALSLDDPPFGLNDVAHRARKKAEAAVPAGEWKRMKAPNSTRDVGDTVPEVVVPAGTADKPTWVIIRLNVKLSASKVLETRFDCTRSDSPAPLQLQLYTALNLVEPCQVYPPAIDFKTMPEGARTGEETVYFWSSTRGFTDSADGLLAALPPPDVARALSPHVSFSPPVPATRDEMTALSLQMSPPPSKDVPNPPVVRVAAAYKTTLRFDRTGTDGGKVIDADLGPFERSVGLTPKGTGLVLTNTPTVKVKAHLLGVVRLVEGRNVKDDKIDLGSFDARKELVREVLLASNAPGIELEAVPELTEPKYLKLDPTLTADRKGDRTQWTITLRIDKDAGGGELKAGSVVVFRIKGTGQLLRIPVIGRGTA